MRNTGFIRRYRCGKFRGFPHNEVGPPCADRFPHLRKRGLWIEACKKLADVRLDDLNVGQTPHARPVRRRLFVIRAIKWSVRKSLLLQKRARTLRGCVTNLVAALS